ncbi:MAG TPA: DUF4126 domain-containing protein [Anaerolineaceae bacterium]|nr:DUF4126 domain-containing protein [Anaerolineaceae bacterium]
MGGTLTGIFSVLSAFGLSASAGLNAYIPLLVVALLAKFTNTITLASPFDALESWWTIGVLIVLSVVEIVADKVPAVDHVNDIVQSVIRPVAGAIIFAASANIITDISPVLSLICGLLVAGSVHATKALVVRPAVNVSTAGVGAPVVSTAEDASAVAISVLSVVAPILMVILVFLLIWLIAWIVRKRRSKKEARLKKENYEQQL